MAPKHPKHTVDTAKTKAALDSAKKAKLMEDALQKDLEKIGATPDSISERNLINVNFMQAVAPTRISGLGDFERKPSLSQRPQSESSQRAERCGCSKTRWG
jgi:hypothetical protein